MENIGDLLSAILPGVAAITTRSPRTVSRTIGALEAGGRSGDNKRIKAFGNELLKMGPDISPEVVLELAAKHKVNPKVAVDYLTQFQQFRRAKKMGRLDDLNLSNAERKSKEMDSKDDFLSSIMNASGTNLDTMEMGGMGGVNLPEVRRNELVTSGMRAGFMPSQVDGLFELIGLDRPKKPEAKDIKLQKIETVDAAGEPIVKFLPIEDVIGQEFPKYQKPDKPKEGEDEKDKQLMRQRKLNMMSKLRGFSEFSRLDEQTADKVVLDVINYERLVNQGTDHFEAAQKARQLTDQRYTGLDQISQIPGPALTENIPGLGGLMGNRDQAVQKAALALSNGQTREAVKSQIIQAGWQPAEAEKMLAEIEAPAGAAPAVPGNQPDPLGIR